jgi:hypothetical protein
MSSRRPALCVASWPAPSTLTANAPCIRVRATTWPRCRAGVWGGCCFCCQVQRLTGALSLWPKWFQRAMNSYDPCATALGARPAWCSRPQYARGGLARGHTVVVHDISCPKRIRFHSRLSLNALSSYNAPMHAFWGEYFAVWARARPCKAGFATGLNHPVPNPPNPFRV